MSIDDDFEDPDDIDGIDKPVPEDLFDCCPGCGEVYCICGMDDDDD